MTFPRAALLVPAIISILTLACDNDNGQIPTAPGATWSSTTSNRLHGQVFDVIPSGRVPAAGIPLSIVVVGVSNCAVAPCAGSSFSRVSTITGPDGRYAVDLLPSGSAVVVVQSPVHQQVCGAGVDLFGNTSLDVHITSKANPQASPQLTPLEISGQVYETTSAGRVAIDGATIGMSHHAQDAPLLVVNTNAQGFYRACGIPTRWPIGFSVARHGYRRSGNLWQAFSANSRVDIELTREP